MTIFKNISITITLLLSVIMQMTAATSIQHFTESDGLPQSTITCVTQDKKGYIWISSWNGLSRYDGYKFQNFKARQGDNCPLLTNRILFIRETKDGNILCKCPDGFYMFNVREKKFAAVKGKKKDQGDRFRPSPQQKRSIESLPEYQGVEMRILFKDRQNGFWIYTHRGLDRLTFTRNKINPQKFGNNGEEFIRTIFRNKEGTLFVADKNGYVRLFPPKSNAARYLDGNGNVVKEPVRFGANVYSIFQDSRGILWLGTKPGGLFRLTKTKDGGFKVKSFIKGAGSHSINCNSIYTIGEDHYGRILVGTYGGGLNIINNPAGDNPAFANCGNLMHKYPACGRFIHDMIICKDGTLLLGTNDGLLVSSIKKQPQQMIFRQNKRIPDNASTISNNQVMALLQAKDGTIYVGTYGGGLNIVRNNAATAENIKFTAMTTEDGMASDIVLNMCEDKSGMIWLVSEHCMMKYNPKDKSFTNYSETFFSDGFSFSEVRPLYDETTGTTLFGTTQGLLTVSDKAIMKSSFTPKIFFDTPSTINLSPEEKNLSISFAALDYNKNEPIQYAYMLEGVDNRWMYTTENHINLTNIPAGTFRLIVKSTNGDGIWRGNAASVTIHRTPYFNERPVAWMIYGGLVLIIIFITFKIYRYTRRLENEIKELKLSKDEKIEYIKVRLGDIITSNNNEEPAKGEKESSAFKAKVEEIVNEHLSDADLNVDAIAKEMCMSRSALYVMMKKEFDCTPNNFILDRRLKAAQKMLVNDESKNVSEIAYSCGFSDPKYFSRCFKKATGMTPTEMRNGVDE